MRPALMSWTELPGPSAFLSLLERDLCETRSVVAVVPACFDDRWLFRLRSQLDDNYEWREVPATPQEFLQAVSPLRDEHPFVCIREILDAGIAGQGFILSFPPPETWQSWIHFLREFAELNRAVDILKRNVFVVVTGGHAIETPNEPLLVERRIEGCIRNEDPLFHASITLGDEVRNELWRKIKLHVCSEIALWDFLLCERLTEQNTNDLLNPYDWLVEYGRERGWENLAKSQDPAELRRTGLLFSMGGEEKIHSALLALQGKRDEIDRRIWIAQVRVLFPLIEEQRYLLLQRLRIIRGSTIRSWEKELSEDEELEIGKLHHKMCESRAFGQTLTQFAWKLKSIRNKLAHLKICLPVDIPGDNEWLR